MLDIKRTIENLKGMTGNIKDLKNDIICAFDTTEKEVIVSKQYGRPEDYQVYENDENSAIISICVEENDEEGTYIITEVW